MLSSAVDGCEEFRSESSGIPHLAKNERDTPNFLYAALERTAYAPFFKERRMKFREPTTLHRKSGIWGTLVRGGGRSLVFEFSHTLFSPCGL
jgi:hypothetical protein